MQRSMSGDLLTWQSYRSISISLSVLPSFTQSLNVQAANNSITGMIHKMFRTMSSLMLGEILEDRPHFPELLSVAAPVLIFQRGLSLIEMVKGLARSEEHTSELQSRFDL